MNHHRLQWSCHWASDHQAGYRVPDSTIPSRHYRSGHRPGRHGLRYIHAVIEKKKNCLH